MGRYLSYRTGPLRLDSLVQLREQVEGDVWPGVVLRVIPVTVERDRDRDRESTASQIAQIAQVSASGWPVRQQRASVCIFRTVSAASDRDVCARYQPMHASR